MHVIILDKLLLEKYFFSNLTCPLNSEIKNINFQMLNKNLKFIKRPLCFLQSLLYKSEKYA